MKTLRLIGSLIILLLLSAQVKADDAPAVVIDDFETGNKGWQAVNPGWVEYEIVDNPLKDGINSSDKVLKITRRPGSADWAGIILKDQGLHTFGLMPEHFRYGFIKILKDSNGDMALKLERDGDAGSFIAQTGYTPSGSWQEVQLDLATANGKSYDDFFIMPDRTANIYEDLVIYIDDLRIEKDPHAIDPEEGVLPGEWELLFADEFEGDSYDSSIWSPQVAGNGFGNNELQYYTDRSENLFTRDGCLVIRALKESYQHLNYTSGKLWTINHKSIKYGKVEARFKVPEGNGAWPAIWMMPANNVYGDWPRSGEIDIMEYVGFDPYKIHATLHSNTGWGANGSGDYIYVEEGAHQDFHTVTLVWEPTYIKWYLDDVLFYAYVNNQSGWEWWPFDEAFYLILNLAVGGDWGGAMGIDDSIFPCEFLIDYVRVYQKVESGDATSQVDDNHFILEQLPNNRLRLTSLSGQALKATVYSVSGEQLLSINSESDSATINMSAWTTGVYVLSAQSGARHYTKKLIKK